MEIGDDKLTWYCGCYCGKYSGGHDGICGPNNGP